MGSESKEVTPGGVAKGITKRDKKVERFLRTGVVGRLSIEPACLFTDYFFFVYTIQRKGAVSYIRKRIAVFVTSINNLCIITISMGP